MRLLITGACGFVGSTLARLLRELQPTWTVYGLDNLSRPGSELNRRPLVDSGATFIHSDLRNQADIEGLPPVDWVIDAAANPSVLAGVAGSTRPVIENNLAGTINLLEYCKRHSAGFILLSTSRVYSIAGLSALPMSEHGRAFCLAKGDLPAGVSARGIAENFSTAPPLSIYGCTKFCSEQLALEYAAAFGFRVWINRCGVMAGAGQFGRADQGIFAYWLHAWREKRALKYIGFGGTGRQVRDCLHPRDLYSLLVAQIETGEGRQAKVVNLSGGIDSATSLAQLSDWCQRRWGCHEVAKDDTTRPFDLPWVVLDHSLATETWGWKPETSTEHVLSEIADFADDNPGWISVSH